MKLRKTLRWVILITLLVPIFIFGAVIFVVTQYEDEVTKSYVKKMNDSHDGLITIGKIHIVPFANFPYISVMIDDVHIYESKDTNSDTILFVQDIIIGFDIIDIINQNFDIKVLSIENGNLNITTHTDGSINLMNALENHHSSDSNTSEPVPFHIRKIKLNNVDLHKRHEGTGVDIETFIFSAVGSFKTKDNSIATHIDGDLELNIIIDGDTTYFSNKDVEINADLLYDIEKKLLTIKPSEIELEHGLFETSGSINLYNNVIFDMELKGKKPNFDVLIAFAPHDIIPILESYNNKGNIYFNAVIQGEFHDEKFPFFDVVFGVDNALLENREKRRKIDGIGFSGHFTNGEKRNLETMEFSVTDIAAQLEKGTFKGYVFVRNFENIDIETKVQADFNVNFLVDFFNLSSIEDVSGSVILDLNFHDIINLNNPEQILLDFNKSYFSELKIEDLKLSSADLAIPVDNLNLHMIMNGNRATLDKCILDIGHSDLSMTGYVSDLPAIVHQMKKEVSAHLEVESNLLDIAELTGYSTNNSTGFNEQVEDFNVALTFVSTGYDINNYEHLPKGRFFLNQLHAKLKHYPHEFHDLNIDILVDDNDLKIVDFVAFIDRSDFHINGLVHDYALWMKDKVHGTANVDLSVTSQLFKLENIFSYQGENYVPKDYRHEEFENLTLHTTLSMQYANSTLQSIDVDLDKLTTKMHVHPMKFEDFSGKFHYKEDHITAEQFHGKIGRTLFNINMNYYTGQDKNIIKKERNFLSLKTNYIDFDQLFNFNFSPPVNNLHSQKEMDRDSYFIQTQNTSSSTKPNTQDVPEHSETFNIYDLPFPNMDYQFDIKHFMYHKIDLQNIHAKIRTTSNHYLYIDTLSLDAAEGRFFISRGYFNGSDPKHIYLRPNLTIDNIDIDKLLFKFENFGQDVLVSENIHGKISAKINGKIRVYPDLIPDLDQSDISMDILVLNGRLVNYDPMEMFSDYFGNKNLKNIRFDTLINHMDINKGVINIPNMVIESTLGHFEFAGKHGMNEEIEYFVRIPLSIIRQVAYYKLFGKKDIQKTTDDEVIKADQNKKNSYINLKVFGTLDNYKIRLKKKKNSK